MTIRTTIHNTLYPFLNLHFRDKLTFISLIFFSLFLLLFDIFTLALLTSIFFKVDSLVLNKIDYIFKIFLVKTNFSINLINLKILSVAVVLFIRNVFYLLQDYKIKSFVFNNYNKNSKKLFEKYASSSFKKFNSKNTHHYLKNLTKETWNCYIGVLYAILNITIDSIYFFLIIVSAVYLLDINLANINIFFIFLFFLLFILLIIFKVRKRGIERISTEQQNYRNTLNILKSYLEIKIYDKVNFFINNYEKNLVKNSKALVYQGVSNLFPKAIMESLIAISLVFFLIYNKLSLNLEFLTILGFLLFRILPTISKIFQSINMLVFYYPASKMLINENKFFSNSPEKKYVINFDIKSLELKKINFRYGKLRIFNNFSYKFLKNNIYGVYGPSGRGKTTLLIILSKLLDVQGGKYIVNNMDITKYKIDWSNKIGLMSQYNILIDDSLSETLFMEKSQDLKLMNFAKKLLIKFNLKKLIKWLNAEYDGTYSLNGMLSGGEKQKLSIIRTFLLGGKVLLLDEPTSSLDNKNEKIVMREIKKLKKDRIIIISTHKKELLRYLDKKVVLE